MKRRDLLKAAIGAVLAPLAVCRHVFATSKPREWIEQVGVMKSLTIGHTEIVAVRLDETEFRCRQIRSDWAGSHPIWRCSDYLDQPVTANLSCVAVPAITFPSRQT